MATFSLKHQQFLILSVCSLFYFQRQPTDESRFECFSYLISLSRCSRRGFKVLYFMISSQSEEILERRSAVMYPSRSTTDRKTVGIDCQHHSVTKVTNTK
ncbi:hypothetical protein KY285_020829 [Solanum tuberosum]|nr:hypothetical protein KY289_021072 [Solanum tuberosum]KAH0693732.1 hypothetical protein KY285_020829 [Solanum tuberosum]